MVLNTTCSRIRKADGAATSSSGWTFSVYAHVLQFQRILVAQRIGNQLYGNDTTGTEGGS